MLIIGSIKLIIPNNIYYYNLRSLSWQKKTKSSDKDLKVEVKAEAEVKKAEPKGMNYDAMSPKQRREYDLANKK